MVIVTTENLIYKLNSFQEQPITESELKTKAELNLWKEQRDDEEEDEEEIVVRIGFAY